MGTGTARGAGGCIRRGCRAARLARTRCAAQSRRIARSGGIRTFGGRAGPAQEKGIRIGQFFTGGVLSQDEFTRRLPVIVYGVFLMLLYIANGFHLQHKHSELDRIADELKQLKTEAVTSSAVRMTLTRQSEIERLLRERGIPLVQDGAPSHVIED